MGEHGLWSYDRREGDLAVLVDENGNSRPVPLTALPEDAKEGMMLRQTGACYVADEAAAAARRERVLALQNRLRRRR